MADGLYQYNQIRSYEVSIWTLQDRFLSVLKWATMDCKGQIQEPEIVLRDDGTQEFSFSIPKFYYIGATKTINPMWLHLENQPLEANMHKLKVVFNKGTEDEHVLEFLVISVAHDHSSDNVDLNVKAEGLAFHELGKIGYKISLSEADYTAALEKWEFYGLVDEQPINNIQFWNDLIFKDKEGQWKTNWVYELQMDWSSFSSLYPDVNKRSDTLYEDEYVSSWQVGDNKQLLPREIQATREKCRIIEVSASNIYNITQSIAEEFGVFCRYEYLYNEQYQIIGRKVIYYNNYIQDLNGHIDLTYPYSSSTITRTVDNSNVITKMYVTGVDYNSDVVTIMDVDANKTKEDYLLNFDYLYEIQGITEEQHDAIKEFETQIHTLNNNLIQIQERIRVLENQLTEVEANAKIYRNAVALDIERQEAAGRERAELTGGTNLIPLDGKSCRVLYNEERGFYINITWEGVIASNLKIYQTFDFSNTNNAYNDLITTYELDMDEFNNLIRIKHITSTKTLHEGDALWLKGYYNPTLAYDNIQKIWKAREVSDNLAATTAESKIEEYSWYLHGQIIGYAQVGACRLTEAEWKPVAVGPISDDYKYKVTDILGEGRVISGEETSIDNLASNYFSDMQSKFYTPNLLYYRDLYIRNKEKLISKFERMMGPALREGYWQPENYHDYGDLYKDDFTINYLDTNETETSTSHLHFIWDGDKYYDSEEPIIYTADASGNVEQHLVIDLSNDLEQVSQHLDDLYFVYCNPSNVAAIMNINAKESSTNTDQEWIDALESGKYSSFRIGSGCELGWIINQNKTERKPVLIVTGAKILDDDTINFIVTNKYITSIVDTDREQIIQVEGTADEKYKSFIGFPVYDEEGNVKLNEWTTIKVVGGTDLFIGLENGKFNRQVEKKDYDSINVPRVPTPQEYQWIRQYPRLYFDSLKLKYEDIKIYCNARQLKEYEEYYTLQDDRSEGINISGIGYYTTIKPEVLYQVNDAAQVTVLYTLSNLDVAIYLDAINVMHENSRPKVSYDVELSVLNPDFVHTAYKRLNQIVHINDNDLQLENVSGYISTVTLKLDKPWEDTVEIKNYETKFEDLFSTIVAQTEAMKSTRPALNTAIAAFTSNGLISESVIHDSINKANLNFSFNSGNLTIDQAEGIWGSSESGVVAFRGGGIFTATERDNSGNWVWNTGILPSGINANLITTGQLDTNKIRIFSGNDLRFQWNGEGLYAYKSFSTEHSTLLQGNDIPDIPSNLVDKKQYVVLKPDGLFLTVEKDAYIAKEYSTEQGPYYSYAKQPKTVDRVEISWKGLILRNFDQQKVFYADPNTGNLILTGNVTATAGQIGGWNINKANLEGHGINLISGYGEDKTGGIYLTNEEQLCKTVIINNETYFIYNYTDPKDGQQKQCYLDYFLPTEKEKIWTPEDGPVWVQKDVVISASPKYTDSVYTVSAEEITNESSSQSQSEEEEPQDELVDGSSVEVISIPTTGTTVIYIVKSSGSTEHIKDKNGNYITYDMTTVPTAEWYQAIKEVDPNGYKNYVNEIITIGYDQVLLSETETIVLTPASDAKITFSVVAATGETTILAGQIGNFDIREDSLANGAIRNSVIDKDNYYDAGGVRHRFGDCFCNIESSSSTGTFTLTRVDGSTVNFNIAAMEAYQQAVAAASALTLVLTNNNGTVTATASTPNSSVTKTITVSTNSGGSGGGGGSSSGCPAACQGECTEGCAYSCVGNCSTGCKNTCKSTCSKTCGENCRQHCSLTCQNNCVGTAR